MYPDIEIYGLAVQSSHYHALLRAPDAVVLADFMEYVNKTVAKMVKRVHDWPEKVWSRRYASIAVLDDEASIDRMRYLFGQATKAGLVLRPRDWPGVHCVDALVRGEKLIGTYYEHDKITRAKRRGKPVDEFSKRYEVRLSNLPAWEGLPGHKVRANYAALERQVEAEARERRRETGTEPLGAARVLAQDPHHAPDKIDTSPAPRCHTTIKELRDRYLEAYRSFVAAFREALATLLSSDVATTFPDQGITPGIRAPALVPVANAP